VSFRSGDTKKSTITTLTDSAAFRWVRQTINLLEKDADPFQFIQLDLPLMPSVLINAKDLGSSYNRILDAVEFHLDNWPTISVPAFAAPAAAEAPVNTGFTSAEDEDEDEEAEEEEEEEDYSDMPDLIPADESINHYHHYQTRQAVRTHHLFLD
jgi:hypothetical protein